MGKQMKTKQMKTGDLIHVPARTSLYWQTNLEGTKHIKITVPRVALYLESLEAPQPAGSNLYDTVILIDDKKYYTLSKHIYKMEDPNGH